MSTRTIQSYKISLYSFCLLLLFLSNLLKRVYLFSNISMFWEFFNYVELLVYAILVYLIIKKGYTLKELLVIAALGTGLLIGFLFSKNAMFFRGFLLIIAGKNFPYKKILKIYIKIAIFVCLVAIGLYVLGLSNKYGFRRNGLALGFTHPNQFSVLVLNISFMTMLLNREKLKLKHSLLIIAINITASMLTKTRSALYVLAIATLIWMLFNKLSNKNRGKWIFILCYMVQIILMIFSIVSALNYVNNPFIKYIDTNYSQLSTFTGRIFLNYKALTMYSINFFGQSINLNSGGLTVDNSYVVSLISMGLIPTIIYIVGYLLIVKKNIANLDYTLLSVTVALSIYAFSEASMIDVINNFVYLSLLTKGNDILKEGGELKNGNGKEGSLLLVWR